MDAVSDHYALAKKVRKPNFSDEELNSLAEGVSEYYNIITGKFSPVLTQEKKNITWKKILERVNAVGINCLRSVDDIKKKWQDMQSGVKKRESGRRKAALETGGGPEQEFIWKHWEEVVLNTLSYKAISGLDGVDTSEPHEKTRMPSISFSNSTQLGTLVVTEEETEPVAVPLTTCEREALGEKVIVSESGDAALETHNAYPSKEKSTRRRNNNNITCQSLLEIESEKVKLKRRKVEILEEILDIERQKLQILKKHFPSSPKQFPALSNLSDYINL